MRLLGLLFSIRLLTAACVEVSGDKITGADLARAVPPLSAIPANDFIGFAPIVGYQRVIAGPILLQIASRYGVELPPTTEVCFERETEILTEQRIIDVIRKEFLGEPVGIEVLEFSPRRVPKGHLRFSRAALRPRVVSAYHAGVVWKGEILDEAGRITEVSTRVNVWTERDQIVAVTPIRSGETVTAAEVRIERVRAFPQPPITSIALRDVVGQIARINIPAGHAVTPSDLRPPSDVNRGDRVVVDAVARGVRLSFTADAESSGSKGQTITARGPWGRQPIRAVVDGPGRATVEVR